MLARSGYDVTLRNLEAAVFEALHVGVSIAVAGQRVLGYYCCDMLPVKGGIEERAHSFLKPAEGTAAYLKYRPLAGHSSDVNSVAFHPTAPLLATSSDDKTAKLWR